MKLNKSGNKRKRLKEANSIRFPKDYHWKLYSCLLADLSQFLPERDISRVKSLIRNRSLIDCIDGLEDWGLQCMNLSDQHNPTWVARYQLGSFLKKFELPANTEHCKATALEKFYAAEADCQYFNTIGYRELCRLTDEETLSVFTYAKSFIRKVLGPLSDADVTIDARHGPGATLDTKNGIVNRFAKYSQWPYSCSRRAFGKAVCLIRSDERWLGALEDSYREQFNIPKYAILDWYTFWHSVIKIDDGNRVTFVPKSAKTFRTIAIESPLNLMLQLGVDGHIRRRLKRWGINMDDQTKNQRLARLGSVTNAYSTVDLSAASDSISLGIVKYLLPTEWYNYLVDLRAHNGFFEDGSSISYQKISSMGNGYTFALETLIFASLVYGVSREKFNTFVRDDIAVFGDDIVVPTILFPLLRKVLNLSGFKLNLEKSFVSGPIRESCGADYFHGILVRPIFLKNQPKNIKDLFNDYNRIKRIIDLRFGLKKSTALSFLYGLIPFSFKKTFGPISDEEFDTYLHSNEPSGSFSNGTWKFERVISRVKTKGVGQLGFRKLMHPLKPGYSNDSLFNTRIGSNFELSHRNGAILELSPSEASIWPSEYTNVVHTKPTFLRRK